MLYLSTSFFKILNVREDLITLCITMPRLYATLFVMLFTYELVCIHASEWHPYGGREFKVSALGDKENCTTAEIKCNEDNANLASILSEKENVFLLGLGGTEAFWFGLFHPNAQGEDDDTWRRWRDGTERTWARWYDSLTAKEPQGNGCQCGELYNGGGGYPSYYRTYWFDEPCQVRKRYICSRDVDECMMADACSFNGRCVNHVSGYSCTCDAGFTDETCETDIDECANITCANNGSCVDSLDRFLCVCLDGYHGNLCQRADNTVVAPCQPYRGWTPTAVVAVLGSLCGMLLIIVLVMSVIIWKLRAKVKSLECTDVYSELSHPVYAPLQIPTYINADNSVQVHGT